MTMPEFEHEMATTRKMLERLPENRLDWKPHPKSNTIGWNACHLAEIPGWGASILAEPYYDMNPPGGEPYRTPSLTTRGEILALFDAGVTAAKKAIAAVDEASVMAPWQLRDNGTVLLEMPRAVAFRTWVLSHSIHHRAILSVYFRMNDVPVPAIYGPSADEDH